MAAAKQPAAITLEELHFIEIVIPFNASSDRHFLALCAFITFQTVGNCADQLAGRPQGAEVFCEEQSFVCLVAGNTEHCLLYS
jgi:hypothetical protein